MPSSKPSVKQIELQARRTVRTSRLAQRSRKTLDSKHASQQARTATRSQNREALNGGLTDAAEAMLAIVAALLPVSCVILALAAVAATHITAAWSRLHR